MRIRSIVALGAAGLLFSSIASNRADAVPSGGEFCRAPLGSAQIHRVEDMAGIHHVPRLGASLFGHENLRLVSVGTKVFYPIGVFGYRALDVSGSFGYRLGGRGYRLLQNASARTRLLAVDSAGKVERVERRRIYRFRQGIDNPAMFSSGALRRFGFYRLDIEIESGDGRVAHFSEYARVLRPRIRAELRLSHHRVDAGDTVFGRVVNGGTAALQFGAVFQLRQFDNGKWVPVGLNDPSPFPAALYELHPGEAEPCFELRLPDGLAGGLYRVQRLVKPVFARHRQPILLKAYVRVGPQN